MAAELVTPIDELTGIPLPLVQTVQMRPERFEPDWHHPLHPRRSPELTGNLGGEALRNCRVQRVSYELHHHEYHETYAGPQLPATELDKLKVITAAAAGYIPEAAITFSGRHQPKIIKLSSDKRQALWHSGRIKIGSPKKVQEFLQEYTLSQPLDGVNDSTIDEFLNTDDEFRRVQLGDTLLGLAVYQVAKPISRMYKEAYEAELIPPDRTRRATRFVLTSLGLRQHRPKLHERLRLSLAGLS